MANEKELNPSPKFPVGEKPELSPNPNFSDGLENKTSEKANTQIVNESKVQPIKNLTVQQIIELIQKYAPGFDPSSVEAGELISALGLDEDGLLKKQALAGLFDGKYVRIVKAPTSTSNLSEEFLEDIKQGCFIDGEFAGFYNPVIFPAYRAEAGVLYGIIIGKLTTTYQNAIKFYAAGRTTSFTARDCMALGWFSNKYAYNLEGELKIKGMDYPSYPANTDVGHFICRKGTLQWYVPVSQDNITNGDTIALDSDLGKALIDHLDVEINDYMARYEYTSGNYVVYSSKTEANSGAKLQVNMISYNTTNGTLAFNQMTFTPDN